jgi:hypothetical protein
MDYASGWSVLALWPHEATLLLSTLSAPLLSNSALSLQSFSTRLKLVPSEWKPVDCWQRAYKSVGTVLPPRLTRGSRIYSE